MAVEFEPLENGLSEDFGDELNARFTALKNAVNVALQWRGAWDNTANYDAHDAVSHGGNKWFALRPNIGVSPTEGADWTILGGGGSGAIADDSVTLQKLAPAVRTMFDRQPQTGIREQLNEGAGGAAIVAGANVTITTLPGGEKQIAATGNLSATLAREVVTVTTSALGNGTTDSSKFATLGRSAWVMRVETDVPAWVRCYTTAAALLADQNRPIDRFAQGEHGLVFDIVTTSGNLGIDFAPMAQGASLESPPVPSYPLAVMRMDGGVSPINVQITALKIEI